MAEILDPFEGPRLKIERAKHHIRDHLAALDAFVANGGFAPLDGKNDPDTGAVELIHTLAKPFPGDVRLTAADALYNLRSALDQAVSRCAVLEEKSADDTYFPHGKDLASFEASLDAKCKKVPEVIRKELRRLQPYYGGNSYLIRALHDLNIVDKHTDLIGVVVLPMAIEREIQLGEVVNRRQRRKQTVITARVAKDDYRLTFAVTFAKVEAIKTEPTPQVLQQLCDLTAGIVEVFAAKMSVSPYRERWPERADPTTRIKVPNIIPGA